ncbi:hypothetical protein G9A89_007774 [Geosiphon pyriformis]|nr:hypothetical protein G9A89_007774 [Geosiphon pyriformis]
MSGAAAYFLVTNISIGIRVLGLLFSTLTELQIIALALKCIPFSCAVILYSNSQSIIDACMTETSLAVSDFCNYCWIKRLHIANLIKNKNILVKWVKVKGHSGVLGNIRADKLVAILDVNNSVLNLFTRLVYNNKKSKKERK